MSFSAFLVAYLIILWLAFGQKWLVNAIEARKDTSAFFAVVYKLRFLLFVALQFVIELAVLSYDRFLN